MKQKQVIIVALILVIIVMLSACGNDSGLNYEICYNGDALKSIMTKVKSNKTDFKINDITLDFYYGSNGGLSGYREDQDLKPVGVGVYFCNANDLDPIYYSHNFSLEDYSNIEGLQFVRFIEMDEYNSEEYDVEITFLRKRFNHKETLTVPSIVIQSDAIYDTSMYFCFVIMRIVYIKSQNNYMRDFTGVLSIEYEFIDEETVRLSDPGHVVFG